MSDDDDFLAYERILILVSDALKAALHGVDAQAAAQRIVNVRQPTASELEAARNENHAAHGGGMPDILKGIVKPPPFDEDEARRRRVIDDILVAALALLPPSE